MGAEQRSSSPKWLTSGQGEFEGKLWTFTRRQEWKATETSPFDGYFPVASAHTPGPAISTNWKLLNR